MGEEHELKGLGSLGKKTPFYRWGKNQPLCSQPAQSGTTARPHGTTARGSGVGVKTGGSRVGGSRTVHLRSMVIGDRGHDVYPGLGPLYGGNTLRPA